MQPATQFGLEQWLSRRTIFATAVAAWTGGALLAGFAGGQMHARAAVEARNAATTVEAHAQPASNGDTSCGPVSTDRSTVWASVETPGSMTTIFLPEDVIVGHTPRTGVTEMQKP